MKMIEVPLAKKQIKNGGPEIVFLGLNIDSIEQMLSIPEEKGFTYWGVPLISKTNHLFTVSFKFVPRTVSLSFLYGLSVLRAANP